MSELKIAPISLRPTVIDIDLDAVEHNFQQIRHLVEPAMVMPVVKAESYGHGMIECAKTLVDAGANYLGVAFVEEGIQLRQAGIEVPILVMGGITGGQIKHFLNWDLDITVASVTMMEAVEEAAQALKKKARVHLKIDTGMNRIGIHHYNASKLFDVARDSRNCELVGVFSHFAAAEDNYKFTQLQLERFHECMHYFERHSLQMPLRHISRSSSMLSMPETRLDLVRPGIAIYGVPPTLPGDIPIKLKPAMKLSSNVVFFKIVKEGEGVSYGLKWVAEKDTRVVTIPVGYGDGYMYRLSNIGSVLIRGKRYPIIGTICMDQIMVDIGDDEAFVGEEVVLVGKQGGEEISAPELARLLGSNSHEVLSSLNQRVPRRFHRGGEVYSK